MNLETIQIPAFITLLLTVTSLVVIPVTAMGMSKLPFTGTSQNSDSADGAACDLPPVLEIDGKGTTAAPGGLPAIDKSTADDFKTATFAMGWFWGPDSRYGSLDGVIRTRVGYAGGKKPDPTYRRIGDHMETIQIDYDPDVISYGDLLKLFFSSHNPARPSLIRQYASAIFYHDEEQKQLAEEAMEDAGRRYGRKISTELIGYDGFTRAEDYHQKYYLRSNRTLMNQYKDLFPNEDAFTDSTAATRVNGYIGGNGSSEQLEMEAPELGLSDEAVDALRGILRKAGK